MPPIISVVGKSEAGKTTLIEKLIPELTQRGYRIGIIKHAFHEFEFDKPGKDSWRHKAAGAETVLVASPGSIIMVKDRHGEMLDDFEMYFQDMDLVLTEGFKHGDKPQIEIFRKKIHKEPLYAGNHNLIAFVTDAEIDIDAPTFGVDDIETLADLIENRYPRPDPDKS